MSEIRRALVTSIYRSNWLQIAGSFVQPGGQLSCVQDKGRKTSAKAAALTRYFPYFV